MTIKDLVLKIIIPLGVDIYFMVTFFLSVPADPPAEGFFLLWFQIVLAFLAIPLLYVIKVVAYYDILPIREIDMMHAKVFYKIIYVIVLVLVTSKLIEAFFA